MTLFTPLIDARTGQPLHDRPPSPAREDAAPCGMTPLGAASIGDHLMDPVVNYTSERAESDQQSTTPNVHMGRYLDALKRGWFPYLRDRWDHRCPRESAATPANAYRVLTELIEFANHLRRLHRVELGGAIWAADSRLETEIPGMSSATIRAALGFLERFGLVEIELTGAGRSSRRDIYIRLDVVLAYPRVAGVPAGRQPRLRPVNAAPGPKNAAPCTLIAAPCRDTDPTDPLYVPKARSSRASELEIPDGETGPRPDPEPDPDVDRGSDRATVGQPSVVGRPSPDEFAAAEPAIRAWRTHDRCEPRKHARTGRRDVDVIMSDKDYLAVRAAASAVVDFGGDPAAVARAVARNMANYHPSMDRGRGSPFVGSFGWHLDTLTDARNAAELAQQVQDAVSTSDSCPNSPQIDPDIPDQHEIDTRLAAIERVDAMSGQEIRDALDALDAEYDPGSRMLRYRLISEIVKAAA